MKNEDTRVGSASAEARLSGKGGCRVVSIVWREEYPTDKPARASFVIKE